MPPVALITAAGGGGAKPVVAAIRKSAGGLARATTATPCAAGWASSTVTRGVTSIRLIGTPARPGEAATAPVSKSGVSTTTPNAGLLTTRPNRCFIPRYPFSPRYAFSVEVSILSACEPRHHT